MISAYLYLLAFIVVICWIVVCGIPFVELFFEKDNERKFNCAICNHELIFREGIVREHYSKCHPLELKEIDERLPTTNKMENIKPPY